jgi:hypothetical protein
MKYEVEATCHRTAHKPLYPPTVTRYLCDADLVVSDYPDISINFKNTGFPIECGVSYRITIEEIFNNHGANI